MLAVRQAMREQGLSCHADTVWVKPSLIVTFAGFAQPEAPFELTRRLPLSVETTPGIKYPHPHRAKMMGVDFSPYPSQDIINYRPSFITDALDQIMEQTRQMSAAYNSACAAWLTEVTDQNGDLIQNKDGWTLSWLGAKLLGLARIETPHQIVYPCPVELPVAFVDGEQI